MDALDVSKPLSDKEFVLRTIPRAWQDHEYGGIWQNMFCYPRGYLGMDYTEARYRLEFPNPEDWCKYREFLRQRVLSDMVA